MNEAGQADFHAELAALPAVELARALIGCHLLYQGVGGRIVETEAYERDDPASHSFPGPTPRNGPMFGPPLSAYVYFCYGVHWCFNVTAGPEGHGAAVLVRALEPLAGLETMVLRRKTARAENLCSGPGKLAQALGIDKSCNGASLQAPPFSLLPGGEPALHLSGPRIGISKAQDFPWRFGLGGSRFLSRPFAS